MGKVLALPERQDASGVWHQVLHDVCYGCGCRYLLAEDDRDLIWEPGTQRGPGCSDDRCDCHTHPIVGERRD